MVQDINDRRADTVILAGQTVERSTLQGLKAASAKSGVSFRFLLAKAAQESSLNTDAQADTSSASGLFQFTRATWLDMVKRYGSQYGFADLSRQILETPSGRLTVTDAAAEKRILALRQDPETSGLMAAEFARDNAAALKDNLGHDPDAAELYLAHFLGASGASALLTASPNSDAADIVPAAAKANPAVFTAADGEPRTAAQVVKLIRDRFTAQMQRYASAETVASDAQPVIPAPSVPTVTNGSALSSGIISQLNLGATTLGQPDVSAMILDQLMRLIVSDPMRVSDGEESEDQPRRFLSTRGLRGSDWADVMVKAHQQEKAVATQPASKSTGRGYPTDPVPKTLDDFI
jgi:hypothetical protein